MLAGDTLSLLFLLTCLRTRVLPVVVFLSGAAGRITAFSCKSCFYWGKSGIPDRTITAGYMYDNTVVQGSLGKLLTVSTLAMLVHSRKRICFITTALKLWNASVNLAYSSLLACVLGKGQVRWAEWRFCMKKKKQDGWFSYHCQWKMWLNWMCILFSESLFSECIWSLVC